MKTSLGIIATMFLFLTSTSFAASLSTYIGKVGNSEITASLTYYNNGKVSGSYSSKKTGKRYILRGNNNVEGRLYFVEYTLNRSTGEYYATADVYLYKRRVKGHIAWTGTMKNYDGRNVTMFLVKTN